MKPFVADGDCRKSAIFETSWQFVVNCPAGCESIANELWGTDGYTWDSYVCAAAIHAGIISRK